MFRLNLFNREERRGARDCERDSQAREAARMFRVRCHENSLTLRVRRCQIALTFTLICFGNGFFALGMTQDGVSRLEKRTDLLLSTLREYVEALAGRLSLVAENESDPKPTGRKRAHS